MLQLKRFKVEDRGVTSEQRPVDKALININSLVEFSFSLDKLKFARQILFYILQTPDFQISQCGKFLWYSDNKYSLIDFLTTCIKRIKLRGIVPPTYKKSKEVKEAKRLVAKLLSDGMPRSFILNQFLI